MVGWIVADDGVTQGVAVHSDARHGAVADVRETGAVPRGSAPGRHRRGTDRSRLLRISCLGADRTLPLVGHHGADVRSRYLRALADDIVGGRCTLAVAVDELHELSAPWLRGLIRRELGQRPGMDAHVIEHCLWREWHAALTRFDPARVDTFPGYVALRLRMALRAAAREVDWMPRRERRKVNELERRDQQGASTGGDAVEGPAESVGHATSSARELTPTGTSGQPDGRVSPDPADDVLERLTAHGVRTALADASAATRARLTRWLEHAHARGQAPPLRLLGAVPDRVRDALAPWADTTPV